MKLITYLSDDKRKANYDQFGHAAFEGGGGSDFKVLVDLIVLLSLTFLKIFSATLVEGLQEEQVIEEMI